MSLIHFWGVQIIQNHKYYQMQLKGNSDCSLKAVASRSGGEIGSRTLPALYRFAVTFVFASPIRIQAPNKKGWFIFCLGFIGI